jgi:cation:H+ antiporter
MEIFLHIVVFLCGLALLVLSSDWLIQSSVKLAFLFKLTPLFIGLVLVAFGTSAPEAGVGIMAAIRGQKEIALGNIVGSNIANMGLIIGLCALILPLGVNKSILKRETPIMLFATLLLWLLSRDLLISRADGAIFILCFIIFLIISYRGAKRSFKAEEIDDFSFLKIFEKINTPFLAFCFAAFSLAGLIYGAYIMVDRGAKLADIFGVSPWIIGITVFAVGTSLPELVASLTASLKKVPSISVGNIVGSNIFNILFVLGIVALIRPIGIEAQAISFEMPILVIFTFVFFTVMRTGYKISRWEGLSLFVGYIVFLAVLFRR